MSVHKDQQRNTWYCKFYYTDHNGEKKQKMKRGFALKRDALQWERTFLDKMQGSSDMAFSSLASLYLEDKKANCKEITYNTKKSRIDHWMKPYFENKAINSITAADVRKWQTDLKTATSGRYAKGENNTLSDAYIYTLCTELSCIFNFAMKYYGLKENPCMIVGHKVGKKTRSLNFWTKEEFDSFIATFEKTDPFYVAFNVLYYTGMRIGELEALQICDIDTENKLIKISKTHHIINGKHTDTAPKTEKSIRDITIPDFLVDMLKTYIASFYKPEPTDRIFISTHSRYGKKLESHCQMANVKKIRIHDIRHSHASLLIDLGFNILLVSERLGHDKVSTTLDIYSHLFPSKQSEVSDKLQALYS